MHIESGIINRICVLRITEDLTIDSDLREVRAIVERDRSIVDLAIGFTRNSCLYTKSISMLLQIVRILEKRRGKLYIIEANDLIAYALGAVGLDRVVRICKSESEVGSPQVLSRRTPLPGGGILTGSRPMPL